MKITLVVASWVLCYCILLWVVHTQARCATPEWAVAMMVCFFTIFPLPLLHVAIAAMIWRPTS